MKYTNIVWDFDGTLIDTYPALAKIFRKLLNQYGGDDTPERISANLVATVPYAIAQYRDKCHLPEDFKERYLAAADKVEPAACKPFAGTEEILRFIQQNGGYNHILTMHRKSALTQLEYHHLESYFQEIVTIEDGFPAKPAPDALLYIIRKYQTQPERVLMVGDREMDILTAKNAGCDSCFFNSNGLPVPEQATYCIEDLRQLEELVR